MAIRANIGTGPIAILTTDTVLYELDENINNRYHVGACNIFNTSTTLTTKVDIYVSPDLTSASGEFVGSVTVGPEGNTDVNEIVGQGYVSGGDVNIIAKAITNTGCNGSTTVTEYSAGD